MSTYQRPVELSLDVEREPRPGTCQSCGEEALAAYSVLSEAGWEDVVKCQRCLHSQSRSGWNRIGPVEFLVDAMLPGTGALPAQGGEDG